MVRKRISIRLLALLLPACTVNTPVGEDNVSVDDRLGEGLGAWCESNCVKITDCAGGELDYDCPAGCGELFGAFAAKNDVCTESGLRLMDCLEEASCSELSDDACGVVEELGRCNASLGQVVCTAPRQSKGNAMPPPPCQLIYDECSSGRVYELSCAGSGPGECQCMIDGQVTGRFHYEGVSCPQPFEVRQICGWPITPDLTDPPTPSPVSCGSGSSTGAAGGGSVGDCEIFFQECSDGTNYGIICDGATTSMCTCRIDGQQVGDFVSPERICPYVFEPDGGGATLSYACGFSIMPAVPE